MDLAIVHPPHANLNEKNCMQMEEMVMRKSSSKYPALLHLGRSSGKQILDQDCIKGRRQSQRERLRERETEREKERDSVPRPGVGTISGKS
jgi:hypothetical protein